MPNTLLVINSGSSSLKVTLFSTNLERLVDAHIKGIGQEKPTLEVHSENKKEISELSNNVTIESGLELIIDAFSKNFGCKKDDVVACGHRFVHGGSHYTESTCLDDEVLNQLKELNFLAPLHNPACLAGIQSAMKLFGKKVVQVAVFDTAFHTTMPPVAKNYAIKHELALKYQIKRYGFHGISHAFLWDAYVKKTKKQNGKIITCHLGNGCSVTAIDSGKSIDTSMGFTPAEGLVMGTRAGDIDAAVVEFLCLYVRKTATEILNILNFESGVLGVSGISSNMYTVEKQYHENKNAKLAIDLFCYRVIKYLGAYMAILGGVDAIIFSGGIGENSPFIRNEILKKLSYCQVFIDKNRNENTKKLFNSDVKNIENDKSKVEILVIATDENRFIANEISKFL